MLVDQAYKNFGGRVSTLSKKLDEKLSLLPDTLSPGASPSGGGQFSSPDVTPPRVEDITSPQPDNVESVDMDMSDEEGNAHR